MGLQLFVVKSLYKSKTGLDFSTRINNYMFQTYPKWLIWQQKIKKTDVFWIMIV